MLFRSHIQRLCLMNQGLILSLVVIPFTLSTQHCFAASSSSLALPLVSIDNFEYIGGFRIPINTYGDSNAKYAHGPITLGANSKTIFMVGHPNQQAIAEFTIPELSTSPDVTDLNMAVVVQPFAEVLGRTETGNPQKMNRIGGLEYVDGELVVNTYEYYDATQDSTHTTLVVRDATNLKEAPIDGFHGYQALAHASGWISPVPWGLQAVIGGSHITGNSSGISPIIARHSVGPSAFAINPSHNIIGGKTPTTIPTTTLLDFSLNHILGDTTNLGTDYLKNKDLTNNLWTYKSNTIYGFIAPGTRSYVTIGSSGGHSSGVGYKIKQDDGTTCGGYCSPLVADNYNYYWLWDLNDLLAVKNGNKEPYDVIPYSYGRFNAPFQIDGFNEIVGAAFDSTTSILFLTIKNADRAQSQYSPVPVIVAYKLPAIPNAPTSLDIQ